MIWKRNCSNCGNEFNVTPIEVVLCLNCQLKLKLELTKVGIIVDE